MTLELGQPVHWTSPRQPTQVVRVLLIEGIPSRLMAQLVLQGTLSPVYLTLLMLGLRCQATIPIHGMIDGQRLDKRVVLIQRGISQMSQDMLVEDAPLKQTRVLAWSKSRMTARVTELLPKLSD